VAVENAIDALIATDDRRRDFFGHNQWVGTLYRAVKPDPAALEVAQRVAGLAVLAEVIWRKMNPNPPEIAAILGRLPVSSTSPSPV
jgi:type I restriction enzyme R subunit